MNSEVCHFCARGNQCDAASGEQHDHSDVQGEAGKSGCNCSVASQHSEPAGQHFFAVVGTEGHDCLDVSRREIVEAV
jgi:hypothetical protein